MTIQHKFYNQNFGDGFQTSEAILQKTPYKPEVLFLGTFNPNTPAANFADFYYGRNFFWPALKNLFVHNSVRLTARRMPTIGAPAAVLKPSLNQIRELCSKLKLSFADLISAVLHNNPTSILFFPNDNIFSYNQEYNLIQDGVRNGIGGLQQLDNLGQVKWNTDNIIEYLCNNPQIKAIYLTRRPTGIWGREWNKIVNHNCMNGRKLTNIFTPSGAGKPVYRSMERLLNHWVHNENPNFGRLDNLWLTNHGVVLNNF